MLIFKYITEEYNMGNTKSRVTYAHVLPVGDQKSLYKIQVILDLMKDGDLLKDSYTIGRTQIDIKSDKYNWVVYFNTRAEMHAFAERAFASFKPKNEVSSVEVYKVLRECGATPIFAAAAATGRSEYEIDLRLKLEAVKKR